MYLFSRLSYIVVLFFLSVTGNAQDSWLSKQTFPGEAREGAVSFVIGNYAYVGLGFSGNGVKNDLWRYNPQSNTWNQMANFGGDARTNAVVFVLNNNAYVGTGESFGTTIIKYKDFWKYDVSRNTWTRVADFGGTARSGAVAFTLNNSAYIGTGEDDTGILNDFWEYNYIKDTWVKKTDIPFEKRKDATAFTKGSKGFICSGWNSGNAALGDILEYDASKDSWTAAISYDRSLYNKQSSEVFVLANKVFLIGGYNTNTVVVYNPATKTLENKENFNPVGETQRQNLIAFTLNGKGYAGLGLTDNAVLRNDLWMYSTPPVAPYGLIATPVDNSNIQLNWTDNSSDEDNFLIERSDGTNNNFIEIATVAANTTNFKSSALKDTSRYFYRVRAVNKAGNSDYSNEVSALTFSLYPPKAPLNLTCEILNDRYYLKWEDVSTNETYFIIEQAENNNSQYIKVDSVVANTVSRIVNTKNLKDSTIYYFRLRAKNEKGYSAYSNEVTLVTRAQGPGGLNAVTKSINQIDLFWKDYSESESAFIIERSVNDNSNFQKLDSISAFTNSYSNFVKYSDRNVSAGTKYFYRIAAIIRGKRIYCETEDHTSPMESGDWLQLKTYPGMQIDDGIGFYNNSTVFMGLGWPGYSRFWAYNLPNNSWTEKANIAEKSWYQSSYMELNNKAYVCLGTFNLNERKKAWEYNFGSNVWTQKSDIPFTDRYNQICFSLNGKAYILGGFDFTNSKLELNDFYQYNPETDTWTQLDNFPGGTCSNLPVFIYNNKAYVLYKENELWEFDPSNLSWIKLRTLTQSARGTAGINIGEFFYILAPNTPEKKISVYEYNFSDNILNEKTCLPGDANKYMVVTKGESSLYVTCGTGKGNSNEFWAYYPFKPVPPSNLVAKPLTQTQIELKWNDETNLELNYMIERGENNNGPFKIIDSVAQNVTLYLDTTALKGKSYFYRIRTKGEQGFSGYSNTAYCKTGLPLKPYINYITTEYGAKWVKINVRPNNYNDYYEGFIIERKEENSAALFVDTVLSTTLPIIDSSVELGKLYSYRISTYSALGVSEYSDAVKVIPGSILHSVDAKVKVQSSYYFDINGYSDYNSCYTTTQVIEPLNIGEQLTISFKEFSVSNKDTLTIYNGPDTKSPILARFDNNSKPKYLLCANNSSGSLTFELTSNCQTSAGWVAYVKSTAFPPPSNLTAVKTTGIDLKWIDNSNSEVSFIIERSELDTLHFTALATMEADAVSFTDFLPNENNIFYYRVKAIYPLGESAYSNIVASDGSLLGTSEIIDKATVILYPNPSNGSCLLKLNLPDKQKATLSIASSSGTVIYSDVFTVNNSAEIPLKIEQLPSGIYFVVVRTNNNVISRTLTIAK